MDYCSEQYFTDIIAEVETHGFKHIGSYTASSDKHTYHVLTIYREAKKTMMAFTIPGKAVMFVVSLSEAFYIDTGKYTHHWDVDIDFNFVIENISEFLETVYVTDPSAGEDDEGWDEDRFPLPKSFRDCGSSSSSNHVSYNVCSNIDSKRDDISELLKLMTERKFMDAVEDGKLRLMWPEMFSPYDSFPSCVEDFHSNFTMPHLAELMEVSDIVDMTVKLSRRQGHKLSNYKVE